MESVGSPLPRNTTFAAGRFERVRPFDEWRDDWEREERSEPIAKWSGPGAGPSAMLPHHAPPMSDRNRWALTGIAAGATYVVAGLVALSSPLGTPAAMGAMLGAAALGGGLAWRELGTRHHARPAVVTVAADKVDAFLEAYPGARSAVGSMLESPGGADPYVDAVMRRWDTSGDGAIDETEAQRRVEVKPRGLGSRERVSVDLRTAFQRADAVDGDGNGSVTGGELRAAMRYNESVYARDRDVVVRVDSHDRRIQFELEGSAFRSESSERGDFNLDVELREGDNVVGDRWTTAEGLAVGAALLDS